MKGLTYEKAGVDIKLGDKASDIFFNAAKQTWKNRQGKLGEVVMPFKGFSGKRYIDVGGLPEGTIMSFNFDGIGTKVEIAERIGKFDTLGKDLLAMVAEDSARDGMEPVLVGSIVDVKALKNKKKQPYLGEVNQLAVGYMDAANDAGVAIFNGETAELGYLVGGYGREFKLNWGAACVAFGHKSRVLTGDKIEEGDAIVGLKEDGFRSNGLSLVRKTLRKAYGRDWHKGREDIAEQVLEPSTIYTKALLDMTGGADLERKPQVEVHGIAHVTGGGVPGKLGRLLEPTGLGARISNPMEVPEIMDYCQTLGKVSNKNAYKTWNMGQGMLVVLPKEQSEEAIKISSRYGFEADVIGTITTDNYIAIRTDANNMEKFSI